MKNKSIAFLLVLILSSHSSAQLLWKVSGNGLEKPSYLFGTHHLISKEQIPDFDKMIQFVKEVDVVVGEMDLSNMLELQLKLMKGATMKDSTLNELLSSDDYIAVDEAFKEVLGMGVKKFSNYKPMMLNSLYTTMLYLKQQNLKKEPEAIDMMIQKFGKKSKKTIVGLETIEQQIDILFNNISLKRQAEMLVSTIKDKDKSTEMLKKLNEFYVKGDLIHLEALNNEDDEMNLEEKKILLESRNNNWMDQFNIMFPKNSCFVAVGCLHLTGETGLLKQLSARGYIIEPVTF